MKTINAACILFALFLCSCGGGGGGGNTAKPDLFLSGSTDLGTGSMNMVEGTEYTLTVNVNNIGDGTALQGWFMRTETSNADSADEKITSSIGPGNSGTYEIKFTPEASDAGTLTFTFTADINGQVNESKEGNNTFTSGVFNVTALIKAPTADN